MRARSKARKRALDVLYESELRGSDPFAALEAGSGSREPVTGYAAELVSGVSAHRERIDDLVSTYAVGWTLERMPPVDRNVLRIGVYELLWRDEVPDAVAVDEAVELVKSLSTAQSPAFVNGLLGRLLDLKPTLTP